MTQFAGGATLSSSFPIYLEGGIAASRYDPTFVASNGQETRAVPMKWTSVSGTSGIGWDFELAPDLKLRPIFNFALGQVVSDAAALVWLIERNTGREFDFLANRHMNAYGVGGSLMLDYERYRIDDDIDLELRYTNIQLKTYGGTAESVQGKSDAVTASLYSRYRAPTGLEALNRPVRYVLEYAYTRYLGDQAGLLGFNYLNSVGAGLELDSTAYDMWVTRTRLVGRYMFGTNVSGFSVGIAMSF
jgi:hypothetical protein